MRIAHFSDCYTPRVNGVTTSIHVLKRALEAAGHEVLLFVPRYLGDNPQEPGLHRFSSFYQHFQPEDRGMLPWPPATLRALWRSRVDVVHIHTPFNAGLLGWSKARLGGVPMVFTHHTLWEEYAHYLSIVPLKVGRWVGRALADFYFQRARAVVMPSEEIAQSLVGSRVKVPHHVIPTGIDCDNFRHGDAKRVLQELNLPPGSRLFLYMGRMGKEKSIDVLLRAFKQYRERGGQAVFALLGGGPGLEDLKALARSLELGETVRFLGYRKRDELKHYLAAATLFLFASQTETQGLVLIEAAAAGVPVIAVRASGVSEAVDSERSGLLLPNLDDQLFADTLCALETDESRRSRWAAAAPLWAENFSDREMARQMLDLYSSLA